MALVGIYLRRSSPGEEQKNSSIENQEAECLKWCEREGHTVYHIWRDPGGRSTTLARPILQEALMAARNGEYQILLVWRFDRLSRDGAQMQATLFQLRRYGVTVTSTQEQVPEGPAGVIVEAAYGFSAETEHAGIISRMYGGRRRRTLHGLLPGTPHPLYGYVYGDVHKPGDKGRYMPDTESVDGNPDHAAATVVRRIYALCATGMSVRQITLRLMADQVPTPYQVLAARGQLAPSRRASANWSIGTVGRLVRNPAYKGEYIAWRDVVEHIPQRDRLTGEMTTKPEKKRRAAGDEALVAMPTDTVPALVTPEEWAATQHALTTHKRLPGPALRVAGRPEMLLSGGIATCGNCGRAIVKKWQIHRHYYRYVCASTSNTRDGKYHPCTMPAFSWKAEEADQIVWAWLMMHIEKPDLLRTKYAAHKERERMVRILATDRRQELEHLVASSRKQEEMSLLLATKASDVDHATFLMAQAEQAKASRLRYEAELEQTARSEAEEQAEEAHLDSVIEQLTTLRDQAAFVRLAHHSTVAEQREMLQAFGVQVILKRPNEPDALTIRWQLDAIPEVLSVEQVVPSDFTPERTRVVTSEDDEDSPAPTASAGAGARAMEPTGRTGRTGKTRNHEAGMEKRPDYRMCHSRSTWACARRAPASPSL